MVKRKKREPTFWIMLHQKLFDILENVLHWRNNHLAREKKVSRLFASLLNEPNEQMSKQHSTTNTFMFQPLLKFHVLAIVIVI